MSKELNLQKLIVDQITQMQIDFKIESFGESLDSLARLEILECLTLELGFDFDYLIVEPSVWETLETFTSEIKKVMDL